MEKKLIIAVLAALLLFSAQTSYAMRIGFGVSINVSDTQKAKKELKTVVFQSDIHCKNCVTKVTENISYLKGVKDLQVSLEDHTITVTFDPKKISENTIMSEIRKLGFTAIIK